jgi:hypothetical protein
LARSIHARSSRHEGLFALESGGTILLDDLDELAVDTPVRPELEPVS